MTGVKISAGMCQNVRISGNDFTLRPEMIFPAGIFWEKTGGKSYRVTIRRNDEMVIRPSCFGMDLSSRESV